jgi:hypothetical protein
MEPSPIRATTGRSGAASWAPTAAGRPKPRPPPAAYRWENGVPGRMQAEIVLSLLPASLTKSVPAGAAAPTAVHSVWGSSGAEAGPVSATAGRGAGAGRLVWLPGKRTRRSLTDSPGRGKLLTGERGRVVAGAGVSPNAAHCHATPDLPPQLGLQRIQLGTGNSDHVGRFDAHRRPCRC